MKEQLLGAGAASGQEVAPFPDDKRHVIVKRLVLVVPDRPEKFIDLMKPLDQIKTEVRKFEMVSTGMLISFCSCERKASLN